MEDAAQNVIDRAAATTGALPAVKKEVHDNISEEEWKKGDFLVARAAAAKSAAPRGSTVRRTRSHGP